MNLVRGCTAEPCRIHHDGKSNTGGMLGFKNGVDPCTVLELHAIHLRR